MPLLTVLALTVGGFGGILTYLCLGLVAAANLQIWAIFLGYLCEKVTGMLVAAPEAAKA